MNKSSKSKPRLVRRTGRVMGAVAALAFAPILGQAQTSAADRAPDPAMKQFVLLFRQSPRQLSEADQKRRSDEVRSWAMTQNSQGRKLQPHILAEESRRIEPVPGNQGVASQDNPVVAIVFLEAADFADAVKVAESHPGLRYGVSVEVRPWSGPRAGPSR